MQYRSNYNTYIHQQNIYKMKRYFILSLAFLLYACDYADSKKRTQTLGTVAENAMVVSAHPLATKVGVDILKKGGNAVDAAIAVQFALAVVFPGAGNIGGGGFLLIREKDGKLNSIDFREKAPAAASVNMFLDEEGIVIDKLSIRGHLAAGVPGSVAGMEAAFKKYATLSWEELLQPAIDLALNGFELTEKEATDLNSIQEDLKKYNTVVPEHLIKSKWEAGDMIYHTDLGHTLIRIRDQGKDGFYKGKTADDIVAEMQRGNGLITHEDLVNYEAVWRTPISDYYKNYKIISMAPPSSGGLALIQLLKSVEPYAIKSWGHNTLQTVHLMTEAERRVYADRAEYLGDPDFTQVPVKQLISDQYNDERMTSFNPLAATPSLEISAGKLMSFQESEETTHFSIVDPFGNAVALTTTINGWYGNTVVVAGSGFFLNNEMDDFSAKPGTPNMFGVIGGEANKIEPGKRMLSSMTPTIVEKDDRLFMVVGTPGGSTIITSVFQTILNVIEHGMGMQEAVNAKRFHSQWLPDLITAEENAFDASTLTALENLGHQFRFRKAIGRVDAILVLKDGRYEGGADSRGDDYAEGF
jgi:gamma-glutamyltranspeptidase / glutathione hydrolase